MFKALVKGSSSDSSRKPSKKARKAMDEANKKQAEERAERALKAAKERLIRERNAALLETEDREMRLDFPVEHMGLVDRLDHHRTGTNFKYAVISTKPVEDQSGALDWLRGFRPKNEKEVIILDEIKPILLTQEFTKVDLAQAARTVKEGPLKPFCLLSEVFIHYVPLTTFLSNSTVVEIKLRDDRYAETATVRKASISSNVGYNILMSLDYCVSVEDLPDLSLVFTSKHRLFKENKSWASVKVIIGLTFLDLAIKGNMRETMAVSQWADSDLLEYVADPSNIDMVIGAEGLRRLREAKQRGDLENTTEAENDVKRISAAATVIANTRDVGRAEPSGLIALMKAKGESDEEARTAAFKPHREHPMPAPTNLGKSSVRSRSSSSSRGRPSLDKRPVKSAMKKARSPPPPSVEEVPEDFSPPTPPSISDTVANLREVDVSEEPNIPPSEQNPHQQSQLDNTGEEQQDNMQEEYDAFLSRV